MDQIGVKFGGGGGLFRNPLFAYLCKIYSTELLAPKDYLLFLEFLLDKFGIEYEHKMVNEAFSWMAQKIGYVDSLCK